MSASTESKPRFYNAIALTEVYYLQITKDDFSRVISDQQRRSLLDKQQFLKSIPEFDNPGLTRSKLQYLCENMHYESRVKDNVIYSEGDPVKHVYFIWRGEVKLYKRV